MKYIFSFLTFFIFTSILCAQAGNSGLSSFKIGVGARALGMGEACVGVPDYSCSGYYNPAVIANSSAPQLMLMHRQWIQDVSTEYLSGTIPLCGFNTEVQVLTTAIPDIEVRTRPGDPEAIFTARDFSLGCTVADKITDDLLIGGTLKYAFEKLFVDEWSGLGYDLGILYLIPKTGLSAGFSLLNAGSVRSDDRMTINLPTSVRGGIAYTFPVEALQSQVLFAADAVQFTHDNLFHLNFGGELVYDKFLSFRAGYQTGYDIRNFTGGIGIRFSGVSADYCIIPFESQAGTTQVFSLGMTF